MPLVIYGLGGVHTHTHAYTRALKVISRNQARTGLWPACAWFKNHKNLHPRKCAAIRHVYVFVCLHAFVCVYVCASAYSMYISMYVCVYVHNSSVPDNIQTSDIFWLKINVSG